MKSSERADRRNTLECCSKDDMDTRSVVHSVDTIPRMAYCYAHSMRLLNHYHPTRPGWSTPLLEKTIKCVSTQVNFVKTTTLGIRVGSGIATCYPSRKGKICREKRME